MALESNITKTIIRNLNLTPGCCAIKLHCGMYGESGVPDILACYNGQMILIEVKQPGSKPGRHQIFVANRFRAAKAIVFTAHSWADVQTVMQDIQTEYDRWKSMPPPKEPSR